ncbi:MAG TPA: hypothetical protein VMG82_02630 [Candidatus Sulfotelmatobacter sp.]|nr:hypothetical protein [Candidatus Sulfotelmatobacter sp.]
MICYGDSAAGDRNSRPEGNLYDAVADIRIEESEVFLPFDPAKIIDNLRLERYPGTQDCWVRSNARKIYYHLRPFLNRTTRERIQKFQLKNWRERQFPAWPVDASVEDIHEQLLLLALRAGKTDTIPFVWFWPDGYSACMIMTHDVEGEAGKNFCSELMDIDDSYGMKASFQLVPENSYSLSQEFLSLIRNRGFEVGLQDLNHDGRLYNSRPEFLRRAKLINQYAGEYGAKGFRAGVLYRNPEWFDAFEFSFDMSIPNVAHLDPQHGGCCTVIPYFIGNILEMPVTTSQDYTLFHLLGERSIDLWKNQIDLILKKSGLMSFIVHPDYVINDGVSDLYRKLLGYLRDLRESTNLWFTLPVQLDAWWRQRSKMRLVPNGKDWRIEGEGAERAVIAYAKKVDGNLVYELEPALTHSSRQ